jgi:hypothetical protein
MTSHRVGVDGEDRVYIETRVSPTSEAGEEASQSISALSNDWFSDCICEPESRESTEVSASYSS